MTTIEGSRPDHHEVPEGPTALARWPDRLITASAVAAWLSMALILVALAVAMVPVRNPRVQDCGTPLAFALTGRVDVYADPNHPPPGLTPAQAESANNNRCQKRVAGRLVPAGAVLLGGLIGGLGGLAMLLVGRSGRRRAIMRAGGPMTPPAGSSAPPDEPDGVPRPRRAQDSAPTSDQAFAPEPPR